MSARASPIVPRRFAVAIVDRDHVLPRHSKAYAGRNRQFRSMQGMPLGGPIRTLAQALRSSSHK